MALLPAAALGGRVSTDGSVGPAATLSGPNFAVTPSLGTQAGTNLFHSFSEFSLSAGEVATFSGPSSVHNVIARVTGGAASDIDGILRCTIPNANFYLINPAGVVFGPHAALDISGSFVVTTADELRLSDSGRFNATTPSAAVLSSAPPAAFGFLSRSPAAVMVSGDSASGAPAALAVAPGRSLSIVAGQIQVYQAVLTAPSGQINLASAASAGTVALDAGSSLPPDMSGVAKRGTVLLSTSSRLVVDGDPAGRISIRAQDVSLDGASTLTASSTGASTGASSGAGGVDLQLTGSLTLAHQSLIAANTGGTSVPGPGGGAVVISAHRLQVRSGAAIETQTTGTGDAGDITLAAPELEVRDAGTTISSASSGPGNAGSVWLQSQTFKLADSASVRLSAPVSTAGNIQISAGRLLVLRKGVLSTESQGAGGDVTLHSPGEIRVFGSLLTTRAGADGGSVTVDPQVFALSRTTVDAEANGTPVFVTIVAQEYLASNNNILTNTAKNYPETDIAGSLVPLAGALQNAAATLFPRCGLLYGGAFSSFVVTGQGGLPPDASGWIPELELRSSPDLAGLDRGTH